MEISSGLFIPLNTLSCRTWSPRQKGKTDIGIARLDDAVETFAGCRGISLQFFVANGGQHRLVVLVNQNDHLMARLLKKACFTTPENRLEMVVSSSFLP